MAPNIQHLQDFNMWLVSTENLNILGWWLNLTSQTTESFWSDIKKLKIIKKQ